MPLDPPIPRSPKSRIRPEPWDGDGREPEAEEVEPGDPGYDEAVDDDDANLVDADRSDGAMYLCIGILPPKSDKSRIHVRPAKGKRIEPEAEWLEPGDEGYEEAGNPKGELTDGLLD